MAREAKAAGNDREAAHLLDNIAIIDQSRGPGSSAAKSSEKKATAPAASPTRPVGNQNASGTERAEPTRGLSHPVDPFLGPHQVLDQDLPPEPTPRSEPAKEPSLKTFAPSPKEPDSSSACARS